MKQLLWILLLWMSFALVGQEVDGPDGYKVFYYPGGQKSSEGMMVGGVPNGYWKTYYPNGMMKSEGNRANFLLDSTWVFYDMEGDTLEKISYRYGMKNGYHQIFKSMAESGRKRVYLASSELFLDDVKQSLASYFYPDGKLYQTIPFVNGKRDGLAREYDRDGNLVMILRYRNDVLFDRERINRRDEKGLRQGVWKEFHPNDRVHIEQNFFNDTLDGQFREYDARGRMVRNLIYARGRLMEDLGTRLPRIVMKQEHYPDGKLKSSGNYRDSVPVGIHRTFAPDGKVLAAKSFDDQGQLLGEGIVDEAGRNQGNWKEFYPDGQLRAEGTFKDGKKTGAWKYLYPGGATEQKGFFQDGKAHGTWTWYFENGQVRREEEYVRGKEEGPSVEYDESGKTIAKGEYFDGEREGNWEFDLGDHRQTGSYKNGLRDGLWKYYHSNGNRKFEGRFVEGYEDGKHVWFFENGFPSETRFYTNGSREKVWKIYDEGGNLLLTIQYRNDREYRINGEKVDPDSGGGRRRPEDPLVRPGTLRH